MPKTALRTKARECPLCQGHLRRLRQPTLVHVGQRTVTIDHTHDVCDTCGESFYAPGEMDALQNRAAEEVRADEGLLSTADIRRIRQKYGLTQSQLERLLGVGPKTVVRWERGTVCQNAATDTLLRLLDEMPAAMRHLAKSKGIPISTGSTAIDSKGSMTRRKQQSA